MTENAKKIFELVENTDLEILRKQAFNEKDEDKQELLMAMYEYELGRKQKEVINRKEFII
ncbi:hypothetical protein ACQW5G_03375 [Fructilactobacillus sp. Tb1]|uniref:hypothetical protein n=1 Tax=Fructilactobacillus sp. Tb1 TaxID=3422304 RepID=UPI003D2A561D